MMSAKQVADCLDACAKDARARAKRATIPDLAYTLVQVATAYERASDMVRLNLVETVDISQR